MTGPRTLLADGGVGHRYSRLPGKLLPGTAAAPARPARTAAARAVVAHTSGNPAVWAVGTAEECP